MKAKPRVAILVPRFGLVDRGVETFTKELFTRLGEDFDITIFSQVKTTEETKKVFCLSESTKILQWLYRLNPCLRKKLDKYFLNPVSIEMLTFSIFALPNLLLGNYDLIFPQNGVWGAIACRLIRVIKKTPFICRSAGGKEPPIVRQKPDVYIATNPQVYDWIKSYSAEAKVVLIPLGVDLEKFSPEVEPVKLELERPIYLCVAALIPAKRTELAIKAISKLKKGSLLVIVDGPLKERITRLGKRVLGAGRFLIKKVPYKKIPHFYTAADVFTLPSRDEPFGVVYLEAMASGLPVVAPDDRSRRYIVGSGGFLCGVEDLEEYSRVLKKVAGLDFGNKPRKQAEKFSWEKVAKEYRRLFGNILKS